MPEKVAREETRIHRASAVAEARFRGGDYLVASRFTLADLTVGVAMQYIDFRYPHDWRAKCPKLAEWLEGISARQSFQETLPPGFVPAS
jgi:glutathione S-transferase